MPLPGVFEGVATDKVPAHLQDVTNCDSVWGNPRVMRIDEHQLDEDGEHWEYECEVCIERNESV
jgi:hypothetical protein